MVLLWTAFDKTISIWKGDFNYICRGVSLAWKYGGSLVAVLYAWRKPNKCFSVEVKVKVAFLQAHSPGERGNGACLHALIPSNGPHQLLRRNNCASCSLFPHQPHHRAMGMCSWAILSHLSPSTAVLPNSVMAKYSLRVGGCGEGHMGEEEEVWSAGPGWGWV